jgi:nicotinamide-nucleotide amidase
MEPLERLELVIKKYAKKNITLAVAESCTGGYVSHMITNISGASKIFERGIVSYGNQAKVDLLNVDKMILEKMGAVSKEVALQMAEGVRAISKQCTIGIGITGIAGPTGGTPEKPVGLVYISFSTSQKTLVKKYVFKTNRLDFKKKVLEVVLQMLEKYVS